MPSLQDVPVVELMNHDRFYEDTSDGRVWHNEDRPHRYYDFGPSSNGHEEHVMMRVEELSCGQHEEFTADCESCREAVFGQDKIADHLRKSRGIELEP